MAHFKVLKAYPDQKRIQAATTPELLDLIQLELEFRNENIAEVVLAAAGDFGLHGDEPGFEVFQSVAFPGILAVDLERDF